MIEIKIPSPGESITEVELANWLVNDGDFVEKDQEIAEVESDKATLPLIAEDSGIVKIIIPEGETIKVGTVVCTIDTSVSGINKKVDKESSSNITEESSKPVIEAESQKKETIASSHLETDTSKVKVTPVAQKLMYENNLSVDDILSGLSRITKKEVESVIAYNKSGNTNTSDNIKKILREEERKKITSLRKKLSNRLVAVKNETAMLTTFNEIDMSEVIALRKKYQQKFIDKHGVKLGYMSFFTKAASIALKLFPNVNSMIDGDEIVQFKYADIGIAVQTDKGLMVPVLRNAESMSMAEIEKNIIDLAAKARKFRLSIDEMSGGTFTITNGGVFGSMLSTPILNPPQAGILGMHNIVDRPVAINGKVEVRPVMYVALSYDHRLIDGRDSVSFLVKVKELIESPFKLLLQADSADRMLLGLE